MQKLILSFPRCIINVLDYNKNCTLCIVKKMYTDYICIKVKEVQNLRSLNCQCAITSPSHYLHVTSDHSLLYSGGRGIQNSLMSYQYYTLTFVRFWITRIYDKGSIGVFIGRGGNHYLFRKDSIHVFAWSKEKDKTIYFFQYKNQVFWS